MSDDIPMMSSGSVMGERPASSGATIPPILATMEDIPTAVLRTTVGYSSALYTYRMAKEADAPNLPAKTGGDRGNHLCDYSSELWPFLDS